MMYGNRHIIANACSKSFLIVWTISHLTFNMHHFLNLFSEIWDVLKEYVAKRPTPALCAHFIPSRKLLSRRNQGFCLTGKENLSRKHSYQNAMVVGSTGTGKSSVVLIPSLYTMQGSFVIHDSSGELYKRTAGRLTQKGYLVQRLNFNDPERSVGYNPIGETHNSSAVNKVATQLVQVTLGSQPSESFWNLQAASLLSVLIQVVHTWESPYHTLANVRELLLQMTIQPERTIALIQKQVDSSIYNTFQVFLSFEEKLRTSIMATCHAALTLFSDTGVARVTSTTTFAISRLRTQKVAVFIQNPTTDQGYYQALTSIFIEQVAAHLMKRIPDKDDYDVFFLVDEAASLYIPGLALYVANLRKYRAGVLLLLQTFQQLIDRYGRAQAETIKTNCFAHLYFTGQPLATAQELEHIFGRYQYEDDAGIVHTRPLMTADEIRTLSPQHALMLCSHYYPMKPRIRPYFKQWRFRYYDQYPPPRQVIIVPPEVPRYSFTHS